MLLACVARGPQFADYEPIEDGKGRLYVYRSTSLIMGGSEVSFEINGRPLANLGVGGYTSVGLRPGSYVVSGQFDYIGPNVDPAVKRRVRVSAGKAVFCRFSQDTNLVTYQWWIECSDDEDAHAELRECKRQDLDEDSPWKP
jgi:hypothetical protein